mmetsp:Transcript_10957/g.23216  ORF Transcript_10957/g.23216 Transcript_10957/m.23216 type:complete len:198 (+) Transcript_10957:140-733(+)|eukprot:CAMPEP_0201118354 /NCGR_PEP_ID=MMETSP0850-20130426/2523_1 /ASSEMBLY_ACC=CAM_ASM_000622 /TAXON_ID=183588 /ORGANISM="Pseudo-nitzschia fraudulenta, Strain WWA7" /LENGTH=197 /DNA_ID=CAMNT_0047383499 /DNA_START=75 /DNA_END=668 /DNA_ORIENTATION=-
MLNFVAKTLPPFLIACATVVSSTSSGVQGLSMSSSPSSQHKIIYGIPNSGWTSPDWNWGYASGTGHDCAAICRRKYATREDRSGLINELLAGSATADLEEVKLVMALKWQNGRWDGSDGGRGGYGDVLATMADARRYEVDGGSKLLFSDMKERFNLLDPSDEDRIVMENLNDEDDGNSALRCCSGLVLKAMDFVNSF